jgi:AraC-like DNA-binding protein
MRHPVPIFRNHEGSFEADTCQPLVEAAQRGEVKLHALVHGHYPGCPLPPGELPGMKTVGFWDARQCQTWGLPWHRNEGIEITFLESGRLAFAVDDREYALQPDALTITRPWQKHRLGDPCVGAGRLHWLILDVGVRRPNQSWKWPGWIMLREPDRTELAGILRQTDRPVWKASTEIRHCFHSIAAAIESDQKGSSISTLTIRVNELLLLFLTLFRKKKPALNESLTTSRRTVELFLADLEAHPEHLALEWSVGEMAESCGLGVTQFVQIVRQLTNLTPLQHLNHQRLERAAVLLHAGHVRSITDLAHVCGYASSQYFATAFHRRFGCPPSLFRERTVGE